MAVVEPLERAAAEQIAILAQGEEADCRIFQPVDRQHMAGLWRRAGAHFGEMLVEQGADIVAVQLALMKICQAIPYLALTASHGKRDLGRAPMLGPC